MNKKIRSRKRTFAIGFSLLVVVVVLGALTYLYVNYEAIIKNKLEAALPETVSIDFGSLVVSPLNGTARVENLVVLLGPGHPGRYHSLRVGTLGAHGIGIMTLLTRDRLELDSLTLDSGQLVIDRVLLSDSTATHMPGQAGSGKLNRLKIGTLNINKLDFLMKGDSSNECTFNTTLRFDNIAVNLGDSPILPEDVAYEIGALTFDSVHYTPEGGMYRYDIRKVMYGKEALAFDSLEIQSRYPKYAFAHRVGKQIDVFDLHIDSVALTGFSPTLLQDSIFQAAAIEVHGARLHVFRDRRMPFIKDHQEPLPMKVLRELPYAIRVGSLDLKDAAITYEEYPEEGDASGNIEFRNVDAHFTGIDNRVDTFNSFINLTVSARFMESGILKAKFAFPLNPDNLYYAEGTLHNFELTNLNPTVEHLAKVRIESGKMNTMAFNFDYSNDIANGSVLLLYEDLKMTALKEKKSRQETNKVKTFFLNVLFAKRNKKDEVRLAKRNGTIQFERDKKRSIFNYWWKSLATGITSSNSINEIFQAEGKHEEIKK